MLVSLALAVAVLFVLSDAWQAFFQPMRTYVVTFDVAGGVSNLQQGSEVRIGGVTFGRVTEIRPRLTEGAPLQTIEVEFELERRVTLFADARVLVTAPLIGSDAWLEIPNVGLPERGEPDGGVLRGISGAGLLTSLLGPENAVRADSIVANAEAIVAETRTSLGPILENVETFTGDTREIVRTVREENWPRWAGQVNQLFEWANNASGSIDEVLEEGRGLMTDSRAVVAENREQVQTIVSNVEAASEDVRNIIAQAEERVGPMIDQLDQILDRGRGAVDEAALAVEGLRMNLDAWAPEVGDTLANTNLASQQLKLGLIELRRSPWKLLYRPQPTELEHEFLYEATRSFALAAADLKAASESVRRVMDRHGDELAGDEETYRRIQQNLLDSLQNYEKAQQQMFDVILTAGP